MQKYGIARTLFISNKCPTHMLIRNVCNFDAPIAFSLSKGPALFFLSISKV
jgi:hypothetical protein